MQRKSTGKSAPRPAPDGNGNQKNGTPKKGKPPPKSRASKKLPEPQAVPLPPAPVPGANDTANGAMPRQPPKQHGRKGSTVQRQGLTWFLEGWIGRAMLNLVVGRKNVGKSSFLAWLMSQARRPAILPGFEESVEVMMLPRWQANNVNLDDLLILDDQHYSPQLQTALLTNILREHGCDLLVIENLDSYLPEGESENDSQGVRPYLESLHKIAVGSGAAIVGTRHPGKVADNLCRGSQAWETTPRITVVLEREDGPAPKHWLWSYRCGVGPQPEPLSYTLAHQGITPPVFTLASEGDRQALLIAQEAPDQMDRARLQVAIGLLNTLLQEDWVEARTVFSEAEKERLGENTIRRAARILGVQYRREGKGLNHKSLWGRAGLDAPWGETDTPDPGLGSG